MNTTKSVSTTTTQPQSVEKQTHSYSFYQKLYFLYFLNLVDWLCTEALLASGQFFEANPLMQGVLNNFWQTIFVKGILPLALILVCCLIYKLADTEESFIIKLLVYLGISAYALVNLWHIFNFVLLFSSF